MRPKSYVVAACALFLASLIGYQSYLLFTSPPVPSTTASPAKDSGQKFTAETNKMNDSLCQGELTGQFYDGLGNLFPVTMQFHIKVNPTNEKLAGRTDVKIRDGEVKVIAEWSKVLPNGYRKMTGTGSTDSVRVTEGRVEHIAVDLENPGSQYAGNLAISTGESKGRAQMDLRGLDGSGADLSGPSTCGDQS